MDVQETRKLLRVWLEEKVDSGHYQGLEWLKKDERIFRIPWYHHNDVTDADKPAIFKIFVDYARLTNKYKEGTEPKYSEFKHNFRCALNKLKSDFERLQDNSKNKNDPHMVYRFVKPINLPHSNSSPGVAGTWNDLASNENACRGPNIPEIVHNVAREYGPNDLNFSPQTNCQANIGSMPNEMPFATPAPGVTPSAFSEYNIADFQSFGTPGFENLSLFQANGDVQYNAGNINVTEEDWTPSDLKTVDFTDLIPPQEPQNLPMSVSSSLNTPENSLTLAEAARVNDVAAPAQSKGRKMIVKVFYGRSKIQVLHENVGENGCRIHFGDRLFPHTQVEDEMYGPKGVTDLMLPIVGDNIEISEREKIFISEIIDKMSRGVILTYKDENIYAQRLSKSRIYVCDARYQSHCLERQSKVPVKVFDFQDFKSSCAAWYSTPTKDLSQRPADHFYLTIGHEIKPVPDINSGCMRNVLICVCVSHVGATEILDWMTAGAQNVDSLEKTQESMPDSMDHLEDMFKGMLNIKSPNNLNKYN
ncbi:interferon regulatory factor [Plakobranchus ocellatus]|uniref:Interferon regulatory factor n=1 Tax=Plakobranchus ocellatus TaxID=259542 RepID=A0AAV4E0F4_9GAST|nr:interferon regulatory factor [Plakobranchus ocellatus]